MDIENIVEMIEMIIWKKNQIILTIIIKCLGINSIGIRQRLSLDHLLSINNIDNSLSQEINFMDLIHIIITFISEKLFNKRF